MTGIRALALLLVVAAGADAQRFYFGIKAGTPLSDSTASAIAGSRLIGSGLSTLNVRSYTLGPSAEFRLWRRLGVEADALYKRLDRTEHHFFGPTWGTVSRFTGNTWEFPFLFKYSFGPSRYRPFAAGGGVFRRLDPVAGSRETSLLTPPVVTRYVPEWDLTQGGYVIGSGLRIRAFRRLMITPELRYTRWTSGTLFPTRNQVEFLLGLGF